MNVLDVLNAERIKLSTIRSPVWSGLAAAVCSLAVAALQGRTYAGAELPPQQAVVGVAVFGVPIAMVLAAMTVTGEYRTGMIRATFAAVPNRPVVLAAKALVAAVFSGLFTVVLTVAAVVVARLSSDPLVGAGLSLAAGGVWRVVGLMAVYAVLAAVLGVGVGALLRHTAGAVVLLLLWPLVVEPIVANLPDLGPRVTPFLPFGNAFAFTGVQWLYPSSEPPWGPSGALLYFVVFVAAVFGGAVILLDRRDA
jgi:hypothetical protein